MLLTSFVFLCHYVMDLFSCGPWHHDHLYTVYFALRISMHCYLSITLYPPQNQQPKLHENRASQHPKRKVEMTSSNQPSWEPPPATCTRHVGSSRHPRVNQQTPTQPSFKKGKYSTKETTVQKTMTIEWWLWNFNQPIKLWLQMNDIRSWWLEYYISPYSAVLLNLLFWTIWHSNLKSRVDGPRLGWNTA